jgi:hypothetical protein
MEYQYKAHAVRIEANQVTPPPASAPVIIRVNLWIRNKRINPMAHSEFEPKSFSSVEDAIAYAKDAARRIIDNGIDEFAHSIDMPPIALAAALDCIESRTSYRYAAGLLRTQYGTPLDNKRWATIKRWVEDETGE